MAMVGMHHARIAPSVARGAIMGIVGAGLAASASSAPASNYGRLWEELFWETGSGGKAAARWPGPGPP